MLSLHKIKSKSLPFRSHLFAAIALSAAAFLCVSELPAASDDGSVRLDEVGVKNLRIETVEVENTTFEETVFALGRIEASPGRKAVVSSRVAGRALTVPAYLDLPIKQDAEALSLESRQPGNPPPTLSLTAPIGGIVTKVNVVPGQPVSPDDSLVEITDLSWVHAHAAVPEHMAGKLKVGQPAQIRSQAYPGRVFTATLAHLGAEADEKAGTLEAAFHVENKDLALRPGMRVEFSIIVGKREDVMSVPRAALLGEPTNRYVYIKHYELKNAFQKRLVVIGAMNDRRVEVTDGLLSGDEVVTRGAYSLSFAGGGTVSLKAALDAAHGHEHAEDGSELTPEKKAAMEAAKRGSSGQAHEDHGGFNVWMAISGVLFVLLIIASVNRKKEPLLTPGETSAKNDSTSTEAN